jgi:catechol 2,3-dioxygenase-like lactoylglutathione lyase family enzyme
MSTCNATITFDHLGVRVKNLAAATRLYAAMLAPLGIVHHGNGGFGPAGGTATLWLYEDPKGGGVHVAFSAGSRAAVNAFHKAGLSSGAIDHGPPGVRDGYSPTYYGAFLLDGDGNNIEAVCMQ